jgi:hypothetical protein
MTSAFEFDAINRVVCWRLQGEVTEDFFVESVQLVADILANTSPKSGIIDFSLVTSFRVSIRVIERVADSEPIFPVLFPRVIVAPVDHVYGLARMFSVLSQRTRPNTRVVRTMDEAYELLRIREPEFKAMGLRRRTGS